MFSAKCPTKYRFIYEMPGIIIKLHVIPLVSHAVLTVLVSNFVPKSSPPPSTLSKFRHNTAPQIKIQPLRHTQIFHFSHLHFFTSQHCPLLPDYLYQKDERELPGKFQSNKFSMPPVTYLVSHYLIFLFPFLFLPEYFTFLDI